MAGKYPQRTAAVFGGFNKKLSRNTSSGLLWTSICLVNGEYSASAAIGVQHALSAFIDTCREVERSRERRERERERRERSIYFRNCDGMNLPLYTSHITACDHM